MVGQGQQERVGKKYVGKEEGEMVFYETAGEKEV